LLLICCADAGDVAPTDVCTSVTHLSQLMMQAASSAGTSAGDTTTSTPGGPGEETCCICQETYAFADLARVPCEAKHLGCPACVTEWDRVGGGRCAACRQQYRPAEDSSSEEDERGDGKGKAGVSSLPATKSADSKRKFKWSWRHELPWLYYGPRNVKPSDKTPVDEKKVSQQVQLSDNVLHSLLRCVSRHVAPCVLFLLGVAQRLQFAAGSCRLLLCVRRALC
jgi:hypothetical protein